MDGDAKCFSVQPNRVKRIARGSGTQENQVMELLTQYKQFAAIMKKMGGPKGLFKQLGGMMGKGNDDMSPAQMARMNQQMAQLMPQDFLRQMGTCCIHRWGTDGHMQPGFPHAYSCIFVPNLLFW